MTCPELMLDQDILHRMLAGRTVLVCVGNEWRGDEAVAPLVAGLIGPSNRVSVVNCGETPENYLGVIASSKPDSLVIISAVDFGGAVGELRVVGRREIGAFELATLAPRLLILTDYVEAETAAATWFIGIQPASLEFGTPLGATVAEVGRELAGAINEAIWGPRSRGPAPPRG